METTLIKYKIGFADGEIEAYTMANHGTLRLYFKTWNDKHLQITFEDTIRFIDNCTGDISDFVRVKGDSFLQEAIQTQYTEIPSSIPYKQYRFIDVDGYPSVEVIAMDIEIEEVEYV